MDETTTTVPPPIRVSDAVLLVENTLFVGFIVGGLYDPRHARHPNHEGGGDCIID